VSRARPYASQIRDEAARATRARILDAAEALLRGSGYHGMTVGALAAAAGVSPQTVYNSIGSKATVLKALYDVRLAGDDEPIPMSDRPQYQAMREQRSIAATLRAYAAIARELYARVGGLVGLVAAEGAGRDEELAAFLDTIERERRIGNGHVVAHLHSRFGLPPGMEPEVAVDIIWTLTSLDIADRLVRRCAWPLERYESWLGDAMVTGVCGLAPSGKARDRRSR
jgi:AcrR family transcriptional regulator